MSFLLCKKFRLKRNRATSWEVGRPWISATPKDLRMRCRPLITLLTRKANTSVSSPLHILQVRKLSSNNVNSRHRMNTIVCAGGVETLPRRRDAPLRAVIDVDHHDFNLINDVLLFLVGLAMC